MSQRLSRLRCRVQHYAWGDADFIPALLRTPNPERKPCAELWMGAHPDLPAEAELDGRWVPLDRLIEASPEDLLGPAVARAFQGRLPYLLKVLSAKSPLSIQAHPSREAAREGFARENAAGLSLDSRNRSYRDANHKPELIAAVTEFYALRGFRPLPEIACFLRHDPGLRGLMPDFEPTAACLKALYEKLMTLPQGEADSILDPLVRRLEEADATRPFTRGEPEHWVLRADRDHSREGHRDRGLFSVFLLNLIHLQPGEAIYLPAGILHAYLEGSGIEIMASSNNVLRGGLTSKHVDVPELLAVLSFESGPAEIVPPARIAGSREWRYETPASEFELRRLEIGAVEPHRSEADHSAEIAIVVAAEENERVTVESGDRSLELGRGDVFLVWSGTPYTLRSAAPATLYKATVPGGGRSG